MGGTNLSHLNDIEVSSCPACGSNAAGVYLAGVADFEHGCEGNWDLLECEDCGLIRLAPFIEESRIGDYYPTNYAPYNAGGDRPARPLVSLVKSLLVLPYTLRYGQPGYFIAPFGRGRLLDVGCGSGLYVRQMSVLGWQCAGVDMSDIAVEEARKLNPDAEFHVGLAGDLEAGEQFDLVTMHHVLEHLPLPRQAIANCYRRLRSGGRLVISVPNIGSFESRCFGRRWKGLDVPRHLLHFREPVLGRLLSDAGFTIESKRSGLFASSISESFIMCLPAGLRRRVMRSWAGHLFYQLLLPFAAFSYLLGNRGTLEFVAVKPAAAAHEVQD